jgi:hypothetical protein
MLFPPLRREDYSLFDEAGKPNMGTEFWTEVSTKKSMERAAHILDLIDERWPSLAPSTFSVGGTLPG